MSDPLRVLSLFSGIGGLDLGLERAGMDVVAFSEVDPYASQVLAHHWPEVPNLGDITTITDWPEADVICGGFPCQDISSAGRQAGIADGTRSGLWFEYARAIRDVRPRYVVVENVAALIARGLDIVLADLAALGYDAWWDCIPAAAVGAPHRRDRVFVVATRGDVAPFDTDTGPMQWAAGYTDCAPANARATSSGSWNAARESGQRDGERSSVADADSASRETRGADAVRDRPSRRRGAGRVQPVGRSGAAADAKVVTEWSGLRTGGSRAQRRGRSGDGGSARLSDADTACVGVEGNGTTGQQEPSASARARLSGRDGAGTRAAHWRAEPGVGRVADGIPRRVDRLRCLGNAVVPQVAQYVGELVVAHHEAAV